MSETGIISQLRKIIQSMHKHYNPDLPDFDIEAALESVQNEDEDIVCVITTACDDNCCPIVSDTLLFIGNANESASIQAERAFIKIGHKHDVKVGADELDNGYFEINGGTVCITWPRKPIPDGIDDGLILA